MSDSPKISAQSAETPAVEKTKTSRLFNRKNKVISETSDPIPQEIPQILTSPSSEAENLPLSQPNAARKAGRRRSAPLPLSSWDFSVLDQVWSEPQKLLLNWIEKGARHALFMTAADTADHSEFLASAEWNGASRATLWTGLRLKASILPELWSALRRELLTEISPEQNDDASHLLRQALGLLPGEWLSLHRFEDQGQWAGLLVVISDQSFVGKPAAKLSPDFKRPNRIEPEFTLETRIEVEPEPVLESQEARIMPTLEVAPVVLEEAPKADEPRLEEAPIELPTLEEAPVEMPQLEVPRSEETATVSEEASPIQAEAPPSVQHEPTQKMERPRSKIPALPTSRPAEFSSAKVMEIGKSSSRENTTQTKTISKFFKRAG